MDEKKSLRLRVKGLKSGMTAQEKVSASAAVVAQLEALPEFRDASVVLAYWSMDDELDVTGLVSRWAGRKRMVLPVVAGDGLLLRECVPGAMQPGYRGILEPGPDCPEVSPDELDLAIVPGLAFDLSGHRLGRGGGFYDRLLPGLDCPKIGVCFPCQLVDLVPTEGHDVTVDAVLCGQVQNN